jgi:hypothetical protein
MTNTLYRCSLLMNQIFYVFMTLEIEKKYLFAPCVDLYRDIDWNLCTIKGLSHSN